MGRRTKETHPRPRPATNPDARENQLISLAIDLAERQLRDGSASSQVIAHFLKLASSKERLEREMMQEQKKLLKAKTEAMESAKRVEELYSKALNAMKSYSGEQNECENDEYYD